MAKKKDQDESYKVAVTKKARAQVLSIPGRGVYHFDDAKSMTIALSPAQARDIEALGYKVEPAKASKASAADDEPKKSAADNEPKKAKTDEGSAGKKEK